MPYTIKADHKGASFVDSELSSPILNYLLEGHTVVIDNDSVPESYLESLFENIRDHLLKLEKHGDINDGCLQSALTNLVTKSSLEETDLSNATPFVMVRMHMLASIEKH